MTLKAFAAIVFALGILAISTVVPMYYLLKLENQAFFENTNLQTIEPQALTRMTMKIPIALPYAQDWESPEEADGLLQYEGQFYTITSKRYVSDTLYIETIKNDNAREIFSQLADAVATNQTGAPTDQQSSVMLKLLISKYYANKQIFCFGPDHALTELLSNITPICAFTYSSPDLRQLTPPPQFS